MRQYPILRVMAKFLIGPIILFGLYVQFHGEYGPGGGFQAGVIIAAAFILFALIYGLERARTVATGGILRSLMALGVLLYAGVGVATILLGGNYLAYDQLDPAHPAHGQHVGIILVELGVGITVAAVMITIFFTFVGRESRPLDRSNDGTARDGQGERPRDGGAA